MKPVGLYGFRIGASTTSYIIRETCDLIWKNLQFVFPTPSENTWARIGAEFNSRWGFPNCLGAIDGKHVVIQVFTKFVYIYKYIYIQVCIYNRVVIVFVLRSEHLISGTLLHKIKL